MDIEIPHGREMLPLQLPDEQVVGVCNPRPMPAAADPDDRLRQSIAAGFQERGLSIKAGPTATACIAITDRTRSTPNERILPILLDQLNALGVPDGHITVISGGGMHAPDDAQQLAANVGEQVLDRVEVLTNDPDNDALMVGMGGEKGCVFFTFAWLLHHLDCRVIVVTDGMTATELQEVHLEHASSLQRAVDDALGRYPPDATVGIMPYAGLVLPTLQST